MNKQFEALEKVACNMADNFYGPVTLPCKTKKLLEEVKELVNELKPEDIQKAQNTLRICTLTNNTEAACEKMRKVKDELGDVLIVLLHISNHFGYDAKTLLHHATTKMLTRFNDPNYNKS